MPKFLSPRYILPTIVLVGIMVVFVRLGDMWSAVTTGKFTAHSAYAETEAKPAAEAEKKEEKKDDKAAAAPDAKKADAPAPASAEAPKIDTPRYTIDDADRSPAEVEVLNQLASRRQELDKRSKEMDKRDALMQVAEQRLDQKLKEMNTLRAQLQAMVNQVGEGQAAQVENLVKIYETMKPDEAARILETLDMPVLLGVIQRMKPARTAPIMAKMSAEKAKDVTVALTKQDQLPQVK